MNREERIKDHLSKTFQPSHLEVVNESASHSVPAGSETHFKVLMVSDIFASVPRVQRQKRVYESLRAEFESGLHALTLRLLTPQEWQSQTAEFKSPPCSSKATK